MRNIIPQPFSAPPWAAGHLSDDTHSCNCPYILNDQWMSGIATVSVDNGKRIVDGGNDAPPLEEAKANQRLISVAPKLYELLWEVNYVGYALDDNLQKEIDEVLSYVAENK